MSKEQIPVVNSVSAPIFGYLPMGGVEDIMAKYTDPSAKVDIQIQNVIIPEKPKRPEKIKKPEKKLEEKKPRDVVKLVLKDPSEQNHYEKRTNMRNFWAKELPNVVRHETSHKVADIQKELVPFMQEQVKKGHSVDFKIKELKEGLKTYGPAFCDVIRYTARKKLSEKVQVTQDAKKRMTFTLLDLPQVATPVASSS